MNYLKVREEKLPPWKKLSAVSQMSPNPDTMEVQMQRSYHLIDEDDTEVDKENVAQGITLTQMFFFNTCLIIFNTWLFYEGCMI